MKMRRAESRRVSANEGVEGRTRSDVVCRTKPTEVLCINDGYLYANSLDEARLEATDVIDAIYLDLSGIAKNHDNHITVPH